MMSLGSSSWLKQAGLLLLTMGVAAWLAPRGSAQEASEKPTIIILRIAADTEEDEDDEEMEDDDDEEMEDDDDDDKEEKEEKELKAKHKKLRKAEKAEKQDRVAASRQAIEALELKQQALVERLEAVQGALQQRTQEVEKLRAALAEREKIAVALKQELGKRLQLAKSKAAAVDKSLVARVEALEVQIKKLWGRLESPSQVKQPPLKREKEVPSKLPPQKTELGQKPSPAFTPSVGSTPRMPSFGGSQVFRRQPTTRWEPVQTTPARKPQPKRPAPDRDVPPPPLPDEGAEYIPPPPAPAFAMNAATVGGVGIVEGDVTAILPGDNQIVLQVATWNDGKRVRTDWVGHRVAICRSGLPSLQPGDHVALDARIDADKGFVWGGKVFELAAALPQVAKK